MNATELDKCALELANAATVLHMAYTVACDTRTEPAVTEAIDHTRHMVDRVCRRIRNERTIPESTGLSG